MKKRVISMFMAAVLCAGLCACGGTAQNSEGAAESSQGQESTDDAGSKSSSGEVVEVDFWSAPNVDQFNFWTGKADQFNQAGIEVDGGKGTADAGISFFRSRYSERHRYRNGSGRF